jgi:hypothetical protein
LRVAIDNQAAVVAIDQVQSREVVMVSVPEPPPGPNADGEFATVTWHLSSAAVGPTTDVSVDLHAIVSAHRRATPKTVSWIAERIRLCSGRPDARVSP